MHKLRLFACLLMLLSPLSASAGTLTNTGLTVSNASTGAPAAVTFSYTLGTALVAGNNLVYAQLPSGFSIATVSGCSSAPFLVTLNGVSKSLGSGGLNAGICVTWNSNSIQINTGVAIAVGTKVTVTIPAAYSTNPTTYGNKTMVSMRTITSSGASIDTPDTLPSVYINPGNVGSQSVGTSSAVIAVVFKFDESTTLNGTTPSQVLTQGLANLDFLDSGTSTCSGSFLAGESCTVNTTFQPTAPGLRRGAVILYDSTGSAISTALLYGTGTAPQVLFSPASQSTIGGTPASPFTVTVDPVGNIYLPDSQSPAVRKIPAGCTSSSCMTTVGGGFVLPTSVALDGAGVLYVADFNDSAVKKVPVGCMSSNCVSTVGGGFSSPFGIVVDGGGNLYLSDAGNSAVKKIPSGCISASCVTTVATGFSSPYGLASDNSSNLYVAEYTGNAVKEIPAGCTSSTCVTVVGGGFDHPYGVATDAAGHIYVADYSNDSIKKMSSGCISSDCVGTLGGTFSGPRGIALDGAGNAYVSDTSGLKLVTRSAAAPLSFADTNVGATSSDSPKVLTIENDGNSILRFPDPSSGKNPSVPTNFAWDSTSTCSQVSSSTGAATLAAGASCTAAIAFKPTSAGSISANLVITDNNGNAPSPAYTTQSVALSGTGIQTVDHFAFSAAPPATTTAGNAFSVQVTAYSDSGTTVAANYTGPVKFTSSDAQASFPSALTMTNGVGTFSITLKTAGSQTLTVADAGGSPSTNSSAIEVRAASASSISAATGSGQSAIITNAFANPLVVQVLDAYANPVGGATVAFSLPASGSSATLSSSSCTTSASAIPAGGCSVSATANETTGTYSVSASVSGVSTNAVFSLTNSSKHAQTISFAPPSTQTFGTSPTLSAMATSGLAVSFTSSTTGVCSITNVGVLTFHSAGTCTIDADQAGSSTYAAAPTVPASFNVSPVVPGAPTITSAVSGDGQATVSFTAPTNTGGTSITMYTVTSNPGGFTATGTASPVTVAGLTNGATYTFTVTATNSAGTGSASAASSSLTLKSAQTITFADPGTQTYGIPANLTASSNSGLAVTFTSSTPAVCAVTPGGALTFLGTGICQIKASQAGDSSYLPATSVTRSFTVAKAAQTITFHAPASITYGAASTVTLSAVGGASGEPVTFTVSSGPGTVSGSTLTLTGAGAVHITANQQGNDNYNAAASATDTFTVSKASSLLTGPAGTTQVVYGQAGSLTVSVAGQYKGSGITVPGDVVSYSITNSSGASVVTSTATLSAGSAVIPVESSLPTGLYSVVVSYAGDTNYSASPSSTFGLQVGQIQPVVTITSPSSSFPYGSSLGIAATAAYNGTAIPGTFTYTASSASGTAQVTSSTILTAGSYTLTASFQPADSQTYKAATATSKLTVSQILPAITLFSSVNPTLVQNATTLTATVSSTVSTPTGTVTFLDGTSSLGTGTLSNGVATLSASTLAVGTHSMTAVYSGDANFLTATSSAVSELVQDFNLNLTSTSGASQTVLPGGTATYSFTFSPVGGSTFPAAVNLAVSGLPTGATYTLTPTTIASGASSTGVTLSITAAQQHASLEHTKPFGGGLASIALGLLALPFAGRIRRRAGRLTQLVAMLLLLVGGLAGAAALSGCGTGNGFLSQSEKSYTVTITGTSGALTRSTTVTLTVE